jgi:hypothetical protein
MNERALEAATSTRIQNWGTPADFFAWQRWCWSFTVDACAEKWNAKHRSYWTKRQNGLAQPWRREVAWCNSEYSGENGRPIVGQWLAHGKHEAMHGGVAVHLVATRPDTDWWRKAVEQGNGPLLRSYFVPETRVWWYLWRDVVCGTYNHDERLEFVAPPGATDKRGKPMEVTGALFPSSLIVFAARAHRRRVKVRPGMALERYTPTSKEAKDNGLMGYPLLTWRMPE